MWFITYKNNRLKALKYRLKPLYFSHLGFLIERVRLYMAENAIFLHQGGFALSKIIAISSRSGYSTINGRIISSVLMKFSRKMKFS